MFCPDEYVRVEPASAPCPVCFHLLPELSAIPVGQPQSHLTSSIAPPRWTRPGHLVRGDKNLMALSGPHPQTHLHCPPLSCCASPFFESVHCISCLVRQGWMGRCPWRHCSSHAGHTDFGRVAKWDFVCSESVCVSAIKPPCGGHSPERSRILNAIEPALMGLSLRALGSPWSEGSLLYSMLPAARRPEHVVRTSSVALLSPCTILSARGLWCTVCSSDGPWKWCILV